LIVFKDVDNSAGGQVASDFTLYVSGNNALPSDFAGSESGTTVKMSGGPYALSESNPNTGSYTASYSDDCQGIINN
jgi:Prealbumin-like fold domain